MFAIGEEGADLEKVNREFFTSRTRLETSLDIEQIGHVGGGGERRCPVEQVRSGPPHQHVVERGRHLVASGVHGFGPQVRLTRDQRFAQLRVERDERPDLVGLRAESVGQVG